MSYRRRRRFAVEKTAVESINLVIAK